MFLFSKKESTEQDTILQDLTEGQLSLVAGGWSSYQDNDDTKKWTKTKHHHHHHHKKHKTTTNDHDWDDRTKTQTYTTHW
jgi:hypothetical protein